MDIIERLKSILTTSNIKASAPQQSTARGLDAVNQIRSSLNLPTSSVQLEMPKFQPPSPISTSRFEPSIPTRTQAPAPIMSPTPVQSRIQPPVNLNVPYPTGKNAFSYQSLTPEATLRLQEQINKAEERGNVSLGPVARLTQALKPKEFATGKVIEPLKESYAVARDLFANPSQFKDKPLDSVLKALGVIGTVPSIMTESVIIPAFDSFKLSLRQAVTGEMPSTEELQRLNTTGKAITLNDALNVKEADNPYLYQANRVFDFAPHLVNVNFAGTPKTAVLASAKKIGKNVDEVSKDVKRVDEAIVQYEKATGEILTPQSKKIVKEIANNPTSIIDKVKQAIRPIKPVESEIINLEPSTATLRTGRYGQNADVVADAVKQNVASIGQKMSSKISLKNIDELARKEATLISGETQRIYKNILDAVEKNPKFSEELAVLQQQHTARIGEAVRNANGDVTADLINALVRPKGFDRLIGQQLVSLKNSADGIFTAVVGQNPKAIESAIGRALTSDELKTLKGITNLEDASTFSDELRLTAKKLNKSAENILLLENELKKLDDYEAQWQKAVDYMARNKIDANDPNQFAEVYRQFFPASVGDWFNLIQYNSMLSSPTTFLNNLSYVSTLLKNTATYTVQGALQQLKSKIYKDYKPEYDLGSGIRYAKGYLNGTWKALGEPVKQWFGDALGDMKNTKSLTDTPNQIPALQGNMWDKTKGVFRRFGEANKKFGETIASLKLPSTSEYEQIRLAKAGTALGYTEDFLKIPANILELTDSLVGTIYKEAELSALTKGVRGKQAKAVDKAMRDLFKGDLTEEGAGILSNFIGGIGDLAMKARNFKAGSNDAGAKAIRATANFILPFIKVPTNWLKIGLEYTPAGLLNLAGAKDKTVPLAKVITGLPITIWTANKYSNGEITGAMPQDKKTRDYWEENGIKPFSIKINNTWYDYTKFNPFMSVTMMTTVGAMEAYRQKDITQMDAERLIAMTLSVYEYWNQQSFVQNMGLLQNINSSDFSLEKINKLGYNAGSRLVPYQALLRWYSRLQDGSIKDPQSFQQTFEQNLPYFKQFAPNKVDSQGNPLKDEFNVYNSFPIFGRKSQQKEGAMEGLKELRNEQFINKSKTQIQNILDDNEKKMKAGQISNIEQTLVPSYIAGLNNTDPLNVYWYNPVANKLETINLDFTKYQPQNQAELKNYVNKYEKTVREVQYNPYISQDNLTNILNRLNVPEKDRLNVSPEQKQQYFKLEVPEEKQPKVKATSEQKAQNIEFSQLKSQLKSELPPLRLQTQAKKTKGKKPRLKKPTLKSTKLAKAKIGSKIVGTTKLKAKKFAMTKLPTPKVKTKKINL